MAQESARARLDRLGNGWMAWSLSLGPVVVACLAIAITVLTLVMATPRASAATDTVYLQGHVKAQVDSLQAQAASVQADIDSQDQEIERLNESYNQLSVQVDAVDQQMASLRRQLETAQADHDYHVHLLDERLIAIYEAGGPDQFLEMLLLPSGLSDFASRIRVAVTLADQDNRLVADLNSGTNQITTILKAIDTQKLAEVTIRQHMDEELSLSQSKLSERQSTLAGLDKQIATIIEQEKERQLQEQRRLQQQLLARLGPWASYNGPLPQIDNAVLTQVVQTAAAYLGIPYVWAGDRPSTGFDCSGFTQYVLAQHGVSLPHFAADQAAMGFPVSPGDIKPGDLVFFGNPIHHVGLYIGGDEFIEAPRTGDVVEISKLSGRSDLSAIRRYPLQTRVGSPKMT
jgi:cell wall-associated NlpC family hydrolase